MPHPCCCAVRQGPGAGVGPGPGGGAPQPPSNECAGRVGDRGGARAAAHDPRRPAAPGARQPALPPAPHAPDPRPPPPAPRSPPACSVVPVALANLKEETKCPICFGAWDCSSQGVVGGCCRWPGSRARLFVGALLERGGWGAQAQRAVGSAPSGPGAPHSRCPSRPPRANARCRQDPGRPRVHGLHASLLCALHRAVPASQHPEPGWQQVSGPTAPHSPRPCPTSTVCPQQLVGRRCGQRPRYHAAGISSPTHGLTPAGSSPSPTLPGQGSAAGSRDGKFDLSAEPVDHGPAAGSARRAASAPCAAPSWEAGVRPGR